MRPAASARHDALLLQKSVDAVPNRDGIASGFDMNVGRAPLDGSRNDLIHKPDDRRFVGDIAQALDIEFAAVVDDRGRVVGLPRLRFRAAS